MIESLRKNPRATSESASVIALPKALKNATELEGMRQCHLRDGAALVKFFAWLHEEIVVKGASSWTEHTVAEQLEQLRSQQERFVSLSFDTICGSGPNGAVIHYHAEAATARPIEANTMLLVDSGGQYLDGTTDVTRTVFMSKDGTQPSAHQKHCFTRVLQGHIALASAVFPKGTTGYQLDLLARLPLWSSGLDYRHGTGHGVGSFLNVHEGPHGIGFRQRVPEVPFDEGMTITNEPGYYEDHAFGIRIENIMVVKKADTPHQYGGTQFFGFETITMAPIQTALVDFSLLTAHELQWLQSYNQTVLQNLSPRLSPSEIAWLQAHIQVPSS